jgi:predicted sulfurtransferase
MFALNNDSLTNTAFIQGEINHSTHSDQKNTKQFNVLLYYIYTPIENAEIVREAQHLFCLENNLLGRIIVAPEGLNGTISGLAEDCMNVLQKLILKLKVIAKMLSKNCMFE